MRQRNVLTIGMGLLALHLLASSASAYYSPRLGRFLSRDPLNEQGAVLLRSQSPVRTFIPRDPIGGRADSNLYRYVDNSPANLIDPLGLAATKPKTQCKLNGQQLTMTFDARTFSGGGQSWPAASGRPITQEESERYRRFVRTGGWFGEELHWFIDITYTFDYSKERQKLNSVGPTKEGKYWIDTCCTNSAKNAKRHRWWHPAKSGWGDYSWELHPYPETDMSGKDGPRSGFFIHGGDRLGSAGCIDLLHNDKSFNDSIVQKVQFDPGETCCYIDIVVKYAAEKVTMVQHVDLGLSY